MGKETVLHSKESHQRENPFGIPCQVYTPPPFISAWYNRSPYKPHEHFIKLHHPHGARHRTGCTGDLAKLRAEPSAAGRAGKRTNSEMDELSSRLTEASDMELVRTRRWGYIRGRRLVQSLPLVWISLDTFFVHPKKVSPPRLPRLAEASDMTLVRTRGRAITSALSLPPSALRASTSLVRGRFWLLFRSQKRKKYSRYFPERKRKQVVTKWDFV